jgi:hypothetical protein
MPPKPPDRSHADSERAPAGAAECRHVLDALLATAGALRGGELHALAAAPPNVLDEALRGFADAHGTGALDVLTLLASERAPRAVRRGAKRALYRLAQRGVSAPAAPRPRPVVTRHPERAVRAWLSAIDGSGARATWIVFEGGFGGRLLCSLIVSDTAGIVEAAGGDITKKRLETELAALRAEQKLPWVESDPRRVVGLVVEALALHARTGTTPPEAFARWRPLFDGAPPATPPSPPEPDPARLERSAELVELPEMAGWFLDPETVQADAVELLGARESRLVVSDQMKAEREDAIVSRVIEREIGTEARALWARRLLEMALVFDAIDRPEHAALARAAAAGFLDTERSAGRHPFAQALARRALEVAGDVATGRVSAADVSRKVTPSAPAST